MRTAALVLAALASIATSAPPPIRAARARGAPQRVELAELRARPGSRLGEEVRFAVQLRAVREDWNAYLSRFEPGRWLALEAWPDELFTWDLSVYEDPFARLFVRRGGGFEPLVRRARAHQRFEVRGKVREVFLGEPWIEVLELVPLDETVGEGTILHVTRARELAFEGELDLALEQYERARAAPLPPHALAALLAEIRTVEERRDAAARRASGATRLPERAPEPGAVTKTRPR